MQRSFIPEKSLTPCSSYQSLTTGNTDSPSKNSPRADSFYQVKPQDLQAIKKRVKGRKHNKENSSLCKSSFLEESKRPKKQVTEPSAEEISPNKCHLHDFQIGDLIGKGASARVRSAIHKWTGYIVSIKSIPRAKVQGNMDVFIRGLKIHMCLDHPNVAKVYGLMVEPKEVHIIMEYFPDGDLSANWKQYQKEGRKTKQLMFRIAEGLSYLHSMRVQHRDLKLENILMGFGVPKITDFELSVYTRLPFLARKTLCGSPAYFSPEMIEKHRYNRKADVWCLGIIFYELLCGYFPFDVHRIEDLNNIISQEFKPCPSCLSDEAVDIIKKMLNKDGEERISVDQVLEHPFFTNALKVHSGNTPDSAVLGQ